MKTGLFLLAVLVLVIAAIAVAPVAAQPPSSDAGGNGSPSGQELGVDHGRTVLASIGDGLGTGKVSLQDF